MSFGLRRLRQYIANGVIPYKRGVYKHYVLQKRINSWVGFIIVMLVVSAIKTDRGYLSIELPYQPRAHFTVNVIGTSSKPKTPSIE